MTGQSSGFGSRWIGDEALRDDMTQIYAFHVLHDKKSLIALKLSSCLREHNGLSSDRYERTYRSGP